VSERQLPGWAAPALAGDWMLWPGLPAGLAEREVRAAFGRTAVDGVRRSALLGSHQVELMELDGLRWWTADGSVVLVELAEPASTTPAGVLLGSLGDADRVSHGRFRRFDATTTEHVYAARGLALTIAESYDDPPVFEPFLAAVLLFAPTDMRGFVLELGGNDRGGPKL